MDEITFLNNTEIEHNDFESLYVKLLEHTKTVLELTVNITMSVTFISSQESIEMNKAYRQKDYIADVISFPIDDDSDIYSQLDFREIGDIFICFEEASNKADKYKHDIQTEMAWLFVHGLLHILEYDHETNEDDAKVMFDLTDKILLLENIKYIMPEE